MMDSDVDPRKDIFRLAETAITGNFLKAVAFFHREIAPLLNWPFVKMTLVCESRPGQDSSEQGWAQARSLQKLIFAAEHRIPYYQLTHRALGITQTHQWGRSTYKTLPLIDRQTLQKHYDFFDPPGFRRLISAYQITSGTTGTPLTVPISRARMIRDAVDLELQARRMGIAIDARRVFKTNYVYVTDALGTKACKRLHVFRLSRFRKYPVPTMYGEEIQRVIQDIENDNPVFLVGKASSLVHLARMCEKAGYPKNGGIRPKAIFSGAEHLSRADRELLEQIFRTTVAQHYGLTETGVIGWECPEESGFHFRPDRFLVEILPPDGRIINPESDSGEIVVTNLQDLRFPLLRYRTGDIGRLYRERCLCGSHLPRVRLLEGRLAEYFVDRAGNKVNPFGLTLDLRKLPIDQYQIIQEALGAIRIRYSTSVSPQAVIDSVRYRIDELLGSETPVFAEQVPTLMKPGERFKPYICLRNGSRN